MTKNPLSLFEVSQRIQNALETAFPSTIWVIGEISELKDNRSGHCYLELVEKDTISDQPKAKARATIWNRTYRIIKPYFETTTGRTLASGIKILVQCVVNYHPVYGLSFNIIDIDPTFTLGDIERVRQQTINRLIADGVMDMNKEIGIPMLPKNIAVVSSQTAAGFEDFLHQIANNIYGYKFNIKLFNAIMQGDKAEESIIQALNAIHKTIEEWDVVAIIRGGGSQLDLGCFDSYNLANNIAQFPIPVITGIGHEKDISIVDMVAHTRLKTPTAVAEFLINIFVSAENWLDEAEENYFDTVKQVLDSNYRIIHNFSRKVIPLVVRVSQTETIKLEKLKHKWSEAIDRLITNKHNSTNYLLSKFKSTTKLKIAKYGNRLNNISKLIVSKPKQLVNYKYDTLQLIEKNANAINPHKILERGYSITYSNGKLVKSIANVNYGDKIETIVLDGKICSVVERNN